jgi:hypothetical protein
MTFERKVESKSDKIKKIEQITKKSKLTDKKSKKAGMNDMAKENAEMLFDLLHGAQMKKDRNLEKNRSRSHSHVF